MASRIRGININRVGMKSEVVNNQRVLEIGRDLLKQYNDLVKEMTEAHDGSHSAGIMAATNMFFEAVCSVVAATYFGLASTLDPKTAVAFLSGVIEMIGSNVRNHLLDEWEARQKHDDGKDGQEETH